jgi:hypothetical protein
MVCRPYLVCQFAAASIFYPTLYGDDSRIILGSVVEFTMLPGWNGCPSSGEGQEVQTRPKPNAARIVGHHMAAVSRRVPTAAPGV